MECDAQGPGGHFAKDWVELAKGEQRGGNPSFQLQKIWAEDSDGEVELPKPPANQIEKARVLKLVPNPRLMLIYFEDREGVARCVKRPEAEPPAKSEVYGQKGRGDDDLYRIA